MSKLSFTVNRSPVTIDVEARTLLVNALRDNLELTGTHVGCDTSQCGCCTVRLNGKAVKSCTMLAVQAQGCHVETIEGLEQYVAEYDAESVAGQPGNKPELLHPVQQAFSSCHALQCGFCTPGMIMATVEILDKHPDPSDEQIREGLSGNLCRCTGYVNIEAAVKVAAADIRNRLGKQTPGSNLSDREQP